MKNLKKNSMRILSILLVLLMAIPLIGIGILADTDATTTAPASPTEPTSPVTTQSPPVTNSPVTTTGPASTEAPSEPKVPYFAWSINGDYKQDYFDGEDFDPTGISVVIAYTDGSTATIPLSEYGNYSPKKLSTKDEYVTVKVTDSISFKIHVNVSSKEVTSISLNGVPKIEYLEGEAFDITSLNVTAFYNDGTSETIDPKKLTVSPAGPLSRSVGEVNVSYGKATYTIYNIKVKPVLSIDVRPNASPLIFGQFQLFDKSKITVTATYEGGVTKAVDNYECETGNFAESGEGKITVKYYGFTKDLDVTVAELENIRVSSKPLKTEYIDGDVLDPTGLVVNGLYSGTIEFPMTGYQIDTSILYADENGESTVTVYYDEYFESSFTVTVHPLTELIIKNPPSKTEYYEGEAIDLTGIVVDAVFANGHKIENFKNYKIPASEMFANSEKNPSIYYNISSTEIKVNVIKITAIMVDRAPDKVIYTEGESFDPTGIKILAGFEDGTYKEIEPGACTFPKEPLKLDETYVTVKYKNFSYEVAIIVTKKVTIVEMSASKMPKVDYVTGQALTLEGLELTIVYSDGSRKVLVEGEYTTAPEVGTVLKAGVDKKITFTHKSADGQTVTFDLPISVTDKGIVSLFIYKKPAKLVYNEGEKFNPDGMVIRAYYNDNSVSEVTDYTYTKTPFIIENDRQDKVNVTISAGGVEVTLEVTVNAVPIKSVVIAVPPTKTDYKLGESFDPTGMIFKVSYTNGVTVDLPLELCQISQNGPFGPTSEEVVTVSFRGKSASLSVVLDKAATESGTESGTVTTDPVGTTAPNEATGKTPTTTGSTPTETTSPEETDPPKKSGMSGTLLAVFISLIIFVVALVVVLVIYYRKHFC